MVDQADQNFFPVLEPSPNFAFGPIAWTIFIPLHDTIRLPIDLPL